MSIRLIAGVGLLVGLCAVPAVVVHAQRYGYDRGTVECRSQNYGRGYCRVHWRDARIVRQLSDTPCRRGENWGMGRHGIWVDRGCSAIFAEADRHHHGWRDRDDDDDNYGYGDWRPPHGWNHRFRISCESRGYRYTFCAVDLGHAGLAYLERQTSNSSCIEGRTWGWNRAGVWVDQGCAGIFTIDRRWR